VKSGQSFPFLEDHVDGQPCREQKRAQDVLPLGLFRDVNDVVVRRGE
jgi:hypothetical protein